MRKRLAATSIAVMTLLGMASAKAVPVTYDFAATTIRLNVVTLVGVDQDAELTRLLSLLPGTLSGGNDLISSPLTGSFTVDAEAAVDLNPDPALGTYRGFDVVPDFSVAFAGFEFSLDPARPGDRPSAFVRNLPTIDSVLLGGVLSPGLLPGTASNFSTLFRFNFMSILNLDVLMSDRVPEDLSQLPKDAIPGTIASLEFFDPESGSSVLYAARVNAVNRRLTVQEPATGWLFGLGVAGLMFHMFRSLRLRAPWHVGAEVHGSESGSYDSNR